MEAALHLSFADAVHGVTTSVNVPEDARCSNCRGTGAAPGTATHTCPRCGGTGSLNDNQGLFSLSTVCPDCVGRGTLFDTPCPVCQGSGTERKVRSVKVRIPAGVEDGQRIRVKGRGAPGQGMAPPGDLYVVVHVGKHPTFGRNGRNLTLTVPITFPEAALGHHHHRAHLGRQGDAQGAGRDRRRAPCCGCAAAACPPEPVATPASRAT